MKTDSLISAGLFKSCFKRFWPLWVIYLVAMLLFFVAPIYSVIAEARDWAQNANDLYNMMVGISGIMNGAALLSAGVAAPIVAISMNDHLFDTRAATFAGSVPLRRRSLFVTTYAAGLAAQVAVIALTFAALLAVRVLLPEFRLVLLAQWLGLELALTFVFYSLAYLVCQLSGSRPVAAVLYIVANILVACIETAIHLVITSLLYGMGDSDYLFDWASPAVGLVHYALLGNAEGFASVGWAAVIAYCAFGAVCSVCACMLHSRRNLEMAGEAVAWPALRPVLKYLAGVSCGLLFSSVAVLLFWDMGRAPSAAAESASRAVELAILMAVGAALGVTLAEMVMSRSTRVLAKSARGAFVLACVAVAFAGIVGTDAFGVARSIPQADNVQQVELRAWGSRAALLTSDEGIDRARQLHADLLSYGGEMTDQPYYQTDITLEYTLTSGRKVSRTYGVYCDEDAKTGEILSEGLGYELVTELEAIANSKEGRQSRFQSFIGPDATDYTVLIDYDVYDDDASTLTLSAADSKDLIDNALKADVMENEAGEYQVLRDTVLDEYGVSINLNSDEMVNLSVWLSDEGSPNCVKWVREHCPQIKLEKIQAE